MLKLTAEKDKLLSALAKALPIVDKKTIMTIINNVLIYSKDDSLFIDATDLEISFRTKIKAKIESEGGLTINPRRLYDIIKEIESENITLEELDNYWIKIPVGTKAEYTIAGLPPDEFPKFQDFPNNKPINIPSKIIKDLIEKTIFSVSYDDRKYALSGILLEIKKENNDTIIRMVSSDGHRLNLAEHKLDLDLEENIYAIILRKGANEIRKLSDIYDSIELLNDEKFLYIKTEDDQLIIRLIEGTFPDYNAIIPNEKIRSIFLDKNKILAALKRISILITDPIYKGVKANINENSIKIESLDKKIGAAQEYITVNYSGEPFELAFNAKYIIDVLNVMKSSTIELTYNDEDSPVTIVGEEDEGFLALIMPMSLEDE